MSLTRLTAIRCTLSELLEGTYVERHDEIPAAVLTAFGPVARAHIIGVIIATDGSRFELDDGFAQMSARWFEERPSLPPGTLVSFVGRPREFNGQRYLVPDFVASTTPDWARVHRLALSQRAPLPTTQANVPTTTSDDPYDRLITAIRTLDTGQGATVDAVLGKTACSETQLTALLAKGDIYEIRPGFVKVLD